jgi:TolA-binding protein
MGARMADNLLTKCLFIVVVLTTAAGCGRQRVLSEGQKLYDAGRYHEAIEVLRPVASGEGEIAEQAQLYLGFANFKLGRHGRAVEQFRDVAERFPDSEYADDAFYWVGRCYEDWGRKGDAVAAYHQALETTPPSGKANVALRAAEAVERLHAELPKASVDSGQTEVSTGPE